MSFKKELDQLIHSMLTIPSISNISWGWAEGSSILSFVLKLLILNQLLLNTGIDVHGLKIQFSPSKIKGVEAFRTKLPRGYLFWDLLHFYVQTFQKFAWGGERGVRPFPLPLSAPMITQNVRKISGWSLLRKLGYARLGQVDLYLFWRSDQPKESFRWSD